jgi:biofilm protein TabA
MKNTGIFSRILFLLLLCVHTQAQKIDVATWTTPSGLQAVPQDSLNASEFIRQYKLNKAHWDTAFAFMRNHDLQALAPGRYPIDGDQVFAIVTQNPTKDFDSTQWESHRDYTDLHYVVAGEEIIGVSPPGNLTITKPYDAAKDIVNYSGKGEMYPAKPGTFFIFFPSDAHRPGISPGGHTADKKIVIKIRYIQ